MCVNIYICDKVHYKDRYLIFVATNICKVSAVTYPGFMTSSTVIVYTFCIWCGLNRVMSTLLFKPERELILTE